MPVRGIFVPLCPLFPLFSFPLAQLAILGHKNCIALAQNSLALLRIAQYSNQCLEALSSSIAQYLFRILSITQHYNKFSFYWQRRNEQHAHSFYIRFYVQSLRKFWLVKCCHVKKSNIDAKSLLCFEFEFFLRTQQIIGFIQPLEANLSNFS